MEPTGVMDRLRDETADLHRAAEGQPFQRRLFAGEVSRGEYAGWLVQMFHLHRVLEEHLLPLMHSDSRFAAITEEQLQEPYLKADLAALDISADLLPPPVPSLAGFIDQIVREASTSPLSLLGYHYVLEGSNNGNRFLARRLVPELSLQQGGARFLEPYGAEQPAVWAAFKQSMAGIGFSTAEIDLLVVAARRMFEAISALSADLDARHTPD